MSAARSPEAAERSQARWVIRYESAESLETAYAEELIHGAVFIATRANLPAGAPAGVELDLAFCGARIPLDGRVVAARPASDAGAPGVSVQLTGSPERLRERLETAIGASLPAADATPPGLTRRAPRYQARASVEIACGERRLRGETANMSTNGVLVLVRSRELGTGSKLQLSVAAPRGGEPLVLRGIVSNHTRCFDDVTALGVQFLYELDRFEEVSRFVDQLRSFHHARSLAAIRGSLADVGLGQVLQNFVNASTAGTLCVTRGDQTGKIAFADGKILHARVGLATGVSALSRLLGWSDASFELRTEVQIDDAAKELMPLGSALVAASIERDELTRSPVAQLAPDTTFTLDRARLRQLARVLDDFAHEVVENAALGFPLSVLVDFGDAGDARLYDTLAELVDSGVLRIDGNDSTQPIEPQSLEGGPRAT